MVTQITSFSRSGLSDWLVQRVTSLILLSYFLYIGAHLVVGIGYTEWRALFDTTGTRIFTLLAVLSLVSHAWIGLWSVYTDYLTERMLGARGNLLRLAVQLGTVLILFVMVIWVIQILWG